VLDLTATSETDLLLGDRTYSVRIDRVPADETGESLGQLVMTLADVTTEREAQESRAQQLLRERTISRTLQQSLLPERLPTYRHLRTTAWHRAAERDLMIGGDWYDVIDTETGTWLVIGDVAGHGVVAAAQASQLRHSLRVYAHEGFSLTEVIQRVNELVLTTGLTEFATVCLARLDHDGARVEVVRAGHPPPLLVPAQGPPELFEEIHGPVLGIDAGGHEVLVTELARGDKLVLYTDGLIERPGESLDAGFERLLEAAEGLGDLEALRAGLVERLVDVAALRDDVALLLAERR
jgi:serine phosphatase RsbU (regulator of sigma subunit)